MRSRPVSPPSPSVADMALARLGWIAGVQTATRRRLLESATVQELPAATMMTSGDEVPQGGQQSGVKLDEPADEEIEATGGGINPRFLAQIFPQLGLMVETPSKATNDDIAVDDSAMASVGSPVASIQFSARQETEYKLRFAGLVRQVVEAQKQSAVKPGATAKSSSVPMKADNVHPRVISNAQEFWGLDAMEARGKFEAFAAVYYRFGRRASTLASQASAVRCWEWFTDTYGYQAYPATMESLIAWTVFNSSRISVKSCRRYISSLRSHHVSEGHSMPDNKDMPHLMRILDGLEWVKKAQEGNRVRLPCTIDVLRAVLAKKLSIATEKGEQDGAISVYSLASFRMAAAVYTFAFGGGLRPSEFTVRVNEQKGYTSLPLKLKDLTLNTLGGDKPHSLVVMLPSRKTDQLGKKSDVVIGRVDDHLGLVEPIDRLLDYLAARRAEGEVLTGESYLFPVKDAGGKLHGLTYHQLTEGMNHDLSAAGFDPSLYQGHSWRIGMATTLAMNGVPEYVIKDMGGWSRNSSAFNLYVRRCPPEQRASFARFLAKPFDGHVVPDVQSTGWQPWRLY